MLSDADIMRRVQAGETGLFALLVERHRPRLQRFAQSKCSNTSEGEDLVQEAFLAAYAARDTYRDCFAFSTWLWTILVNLSRRSRQQQMHRLQREAEYVWRTKQQADTGPTTLQHLLLTERNQQLRDQLEQLPEVEADAIRLRFFGELSFEEIALAMQSSVSGAKVRVRRGLERLATMLDESDIAG